MIAILNHSSLVPPLVGAQMIAAVARQMREHFAPAWSSLPTTPTLYASPADVPAGLPVLLLVDDSDDPGALGYHTEQFDGAITGIVAAKPVLDMGGALLAGDLSVSGVLSHECIELRDLFVNMWADAPGGDSWAFELCDPVQEDSYEIDGVAVSNFVLPHFFDDSPPAGARFDYLGRLSAPFSLSRGGYAVVRDRTGAVRQLGARRSRRSARFAKRIAAR